MAKMSKILEYYMVMAERHTGFWIGLPLATGKTVAREEWLRLMKEDPEHFHLVEIRPEEQTGYSHGIENVIEHAVFVTWSDEQVQ